MSALTSVLLPGLDGSGVLFERFLAAAPVGIEPTCVALPPDRPRSYGELVEWVEPRLPEGPLALIAESFSGPLAVLLAARCARVRKVVLCATFVEPPLPLAGLLARVPSALWSRPPPEALLALVLTGGDRELARSIRRVLAHVNGEIIVSRIRQALRVNIAAELARVSCPVLTLSAKRDHIMRTRIADRLASGTHIELDAPHLLLQTRPVEAWAHIAPWIVQPSG